MGCPHCCLYIHVVCADSVPLLVAPPTEAEKLRQLLLELGCLIKITEIINSIQTEVKEVSLPPPLTITRPPHPLPLTLTPSLLPPSPSLSPPSPQDTTMRCALACCVLSSLTAVMQGSPTICHAYEATVGYAKLRELLSHLTPPSTDVLLQALNMVSC